MIRRPPKTTLTEPLFPYMPLFRSAGYLCARRIGVCSPAVRSRHRTRYPVRRQLSTVGLCGGSAPRRVARTGRKTAKQRGPRSEEHTSELQSLMRISYAVFCLKKKKIIHEIHTISHKLHTLQHIINKNILN